MVNKYAAPDVLAARRLALLDVIRAGIDRARRQEQRLVVSWVERVDLPSPVAFYEQGSRLGPGRIYWERPDQAFAVVGAGVAARLVLPTGQTLAALSSSCRELLESAFIAGEPTESPGAGPVLIGGGAFDPARIPGPRWEGFPSGQLILPRFVLTSSGGFAWLTANVVVGADSDDEAEVDRVVREASWIWPGDSFPFSKEPEFSTTMDEDRPAEAWQALVAEFARAARQGTVEKVVLARSIRLSSSRPFSPAAALRRLRAEYPACAVFAFEQGDRCFLGASPERLAGVVGSDVEVSCLAGTVKRGTTSAEDLRNGEELLASTKNQWEHAIVVRTLREKLEGVCTDVSVPSGPVLLKVRNVQHLYTPIRARLVKGQTLLDLAGQLHPTPAVGGFPREHALDLIREREGLDRGWYAGPMGWIDRWGNGEFAVAIRSALLHENRAILFAGCGIVADSDPASEYEESRLKLMPMLSALGVRG